MPHVLSSHSVYIEKYGVYRWVLRECVRANPMFVFSAALLAYGVLQLNVEIDPQIGKEGGVLASLALLHVYEFAILIVAAVILKRRTGGGRDLHGLMIVAALFMSGSFLALDEQIAITPRWGIGLALLAVGLAGIKLSLYARLPGIFLPFKYRACLLLVIAGHAVSPLLGEAKLAFDYGKTALQGIGWLAGWLSMLPLLWLIWHEHIHPAPLKSSAPSDPMETRWCGIWAMVVTLGTSIFHLVAADWVFDRPSVSGTMYPALCMLATMAVMLRWQRVRKLEFWTTTLMLAQVYALQTLWADWASPASNWNWEMPFSAAVQTWAACVIGALVLARATGAPEFYYALGSPATAPAWSWAYHSRGRIPHFHALLSSMMGFVFLVVGMVISLYRDRLLRWLDPERKVVAPIPISPSLPDELNDEPI